MQTLEPPPAAVGDRDSVQILSAWIAKGAQWVVLNPHVYRSRNFEEEWAWGVLLADTMRHLANAIADTRGESPADVLAGIRDALEVELAKPSSKLAGGYVEHPG